MVAELGYMKGLFPPERCSLPFGNCSAGNSDTETLIAHHNMLLSHAKAVNLYRKTFQVIKMTLKSDSLYTLEISAFGRKC